MAFCRSIACTGGTPLRIAAQYSGPVDSRGYIGFAQYIGYFLSAKIDQLKLGVRTLILYAVLGILGAAAAATILVVAVVIAAKAAAEAAGNAAGPRCSRDSPGPPCPRRR